MLKFDEMKFFDYTEISKEMWRNKLGAAQEVAKISFDTENDYYIKNRTIKIDQNQWEHTDCSFRCVLYEAGGDWQRPTIYFRCQLYKGYADLNSVPGVENQAAADGEFFCFIPNKDQGNNVLIGENNKFGPVDSDNEDEKHKNNERACWDTLKKHLTKLVKQEVKKIRAKSQQMAEESTCSKCSHSVKRVSVHKRISAVRQAMQVRINDSSRDKLTWQVPFPKEVDCPYCNGKARFALVVHEGSDEKKYVTNKYSNDPDGEGYWPHDAMAIANYICRDCGEAVAKWNQA